MTETRTVLGVDPGTTTGLALLHLNDKAPALQLGRQYGWKDGADTVFRLSKVMAIRRTAGATAECAVAAERFMVSAATARRGQAYVEDAMFMLGVVRAAGMFNDVEVVLGQVSAAKKLISDDVLKQLDLYQRGLRHANDAARHAAMLALKKGWLNADLLVPR